MNDLSEDEGDKNDGKSDVSFKYWCINWKIIFETIR